MPKPRKKPAFSPSTNPSSTPVAVAPAGELAARKLLAAQLDTEIHRLRSDLAANAYSLGTKLERVSNDKLYFLLGARTFHGYVEKLGFGHSQVAKWRFVAAQFKEEDAKTYGMEKLYVLGDHLRDKKQPLPPDLSAYLVNTHSGMKRFPEVSLAVLIDAFRTDQETPADEAARDYANEIYNKLPEVSAHLDVRIERATSKSPPKIVFIVQKPSFEKAVVLLASRLSPARPPGGGGRPR